MLFYYTMCFRLVSDKEKLLDELHRVLKSGGLLFATAEHLDLNEFMNIIAKRDIEELLREHDLEAEIPVVIALNFVESAEKKGIRIAHKKLSEILGAPVIPINPLKKWGMGELVNALLEIKETKGKTFTVRYDDHIEDAITEVSSRVTRTQLPKRFVALRVLEEDADFYGYLRDNRSS